MTTRIKQTALLVVAGVALGLAGCGDTVSDRAPESTGTAPQPIRTEAQPTEVKVERRDITGYEFLSGDLYTPPESQAYATAPPNTPVSKVLTSEGQRVGRGEVLAQIGVGEEQMALDQAKAQLDSAHAAYAQADAQYGAALKAARQNLAQARDAERQARQRTIPGGDASELTAARDARQAAQLEVDRQQAEFNTQMLPYKQAVDAAQKAYNDARNAAKQNTVEAPITGTVVDLLVGPGQSVPANGQVAQIVDLNDLQVKASVLPSQHELVEKSKHVYIRFNDFPEKLFDGHVISVKAVPAESGNRVSHEAVISFDNDGGVIKPNAGVRSIGIVLGKANDVMAVPVGAVDRDDNAKPFVMVKNGENWVKTPVELGLSDGDYVQVKSGLSEGQTVQVVPNRNEVGPVAETVKK